MKQARVCRMFTWGLITLTSQAVATEPEDRSVMRNAHFGPYYQLACQGDYQRISLDSSADAATQNEIELTQRHFYQFQLSDSGVGFMQLLVPEWATKLIIGHSADVEVSLLKATKLMDNLHNSHCETGATRVSHFEVHEWGSYSLRLTGRPLKQVKISILKEAK